MIGGRFGPFVARGPCFIQSAPATAFKATLQALTAVPPDRQKIMLKGGILKDDTDMTKVGIKDGASVMMMGSAEVVEAPKEQIKFAEDLTEGELNKAVRI